MATLTRNEILMQARQATESAPVSEVTYSDYELGQRNAMRSALEALRDLAEVWRVENERAVARRKRLAREAVALAYLQARVRPNAVQVTHSEEIITSAPAVSARKVNPLADTVVIRRPVAGSGQPSLRSVDHLEQPFPLCRPILRSKVVARRPTAIGCFFRAVNIFLKG